MSLSALRGTTALWLPLVAGVLVALPPGAGAQGAAAAPAAPAAASATAPTDSAAALAEEIVVLRVLKPLKLSADQLPTLTTAVTQAQDRLSKQAQADRHTVAALHEPVTQARRQLLPLNVDLNDPRLTTALTADQKVMDAQRAAEQNQVRLRSELDAALRQQLAALLTPDQMASLVAQGSAILTAERAQQEQQRQQRLQQFQQAMAARGVVPGGASPGRPGPGGRGSRGGPGARGPEGMMDRMRGMDPEQYQRMSRGLARRFGDEGTPAYQNALAMMDQIRSLPDDQYRSQRATLAQQFAAGIAGAQDPANAAGMSGDDRALETWIERYLLSPQAPAALKDLSGAADARGTS